MPPSLAHLGPAEGSLARRATASLRVFGDEFLRAPPPPEEQQAPLAYRLGVVSKFQLIPQGSLEGDDEAGDADEEEEDEEAGVAAAADGTTGQATEAASAPSPTALSAPGQTSHPSPPTGVVGKNGASGSKAKLPMHKRNVHKTLLERSNSPPRRALYDMRREGLHLAIERARSPAFQSGTGDGLDDGAGGDDGSLGWREEQAWGGAASLRRGDRFDMRQSPRRRGRFGDEPVEEQRLLTPGQLKQAVEEAFTYLMSNDGAEPAQPAAEAADGDDEEEEGKEDFDEEEEEERLASHPHTPSESSSASPSSTPLDLASKQEGTAADTSSPIGGGRSGGAIVTAGGASGGLSGVKLRARVAMAEAKEADTKLQCAQSLCTWAAHEGNVERLFTEGAVDAVIRLSKEQQPLIRRYCARAFRRMSARPLLAKEMLAVGGIVSLLARMVRPEAPTPPAASTRGAGALSPYQYQQQQQQQQLQQYQHAVPQQVVVDCLAALVNLTTVPESEAQLVEDGIVPALMSSLKDREDYDELCARGLYNLTCVDAPYPFIDRVIKALVSLAASGVPAVRQLCALALCNLAALKPMRLRLVEEGVVQVRGGGESVDTIRCLYFT